LTNAIGYKQKEIEKPPPLEYQRSKTEP